MNIHEFQSSRQSIPTSLVEAFGLVTLLYGIALAMTLPWSLPGSLPNASTAEMVLRIIFAVNFAITICRWSFVQSIAFLEFRRLPTLDTSASPNLPFVSILVPAFNEEETIEAALNSLISLRYPKYEVIVIDDGSTDATYQRAKRFEAVHGNAEVRVVTKPNGGKWSALNHGFDIAVGSLLLCVDADTRLDSETLAISVARMLSDRRIGGIAGQVTIRNRKNFITRMQAIEYVLGNGGMRMAMSAGGLVTVVPGAIGLYRRSVLHEVAKLNETISAPVKSPGRVSGPWSGDTFAEDFQLSLSVLALGYRVVYEPRAIAFTKGPERIDTLLSQRYRWMRGTWQVVSIYMRKLHAVAKIRRPLLPWVMGACYTADIWLIPLVNFLFWGWFVFMLSTVPNIGPLILVLTTITLLNVMAAAIYVVVQRDDFRLIPLAALMDLYLAYFVNAAWVIAAVDEIRGTRMKWH